ncbi:hypothetical protein U472_15085 [Orenia metallireducens]|uniref:ATP synthase I chain n=1 Tax=Orenia metallireducens TaxID=1413210 RepID=A0A1C0A675_9FIRM|nr:ATP synthase subunit I [Orenia metallireducens]OCL25652.1 hypothetical protein U472_15085 [Orenia metallireducens]
MKELRRTEYFVIKYTIILNLFLAILLLAFFDKKSAFGLLVGSIMGIINFHLLAISLQKAVKFTPTKAQAYMVVQYIFRYILWFTVFYIALKRQDVNLLTTIIGMLTIKFVILLSNIFKFYPQNEELTRKEGS